MFEADSVTRLFRITRHIGAVATGLIADARSLISRARHEASDYAYKHAHPIPIDLLARRIANLNQLSTQEAGMRPMGVALTLIGIDEERGGPKVNVFCVDIILFILIFIYLRCSNVTRLAFTLDTLPPLPVPNPLTSKTPSKRS